MCTYVTCLESDTSYANYYYSLLALCCACVCQTEIGGGIYGACQNPDKRGYLWHLDDDDSVAWRLGKE